MRLRWNVFVAACAVPGLPAYADTAWKLDPALSGDWFTAANWTAGVPVPAAAAIVENGGTVTLSSGTAAAFTFRAGQNGTGYFAQAGGQLSVRDVEVGGFNGFTGGYAMTGGALVTTGSVSVGSNSAAAMTQTGGTVQTQALFLGHNAGSRGTYTLADTANLAVPNALTIAPSYGSAGAFRQTGGAVSAGTLTLGAWLNATGTYELSAGTLAAKAVHVSYLSPNTSDYGTGTFSQTGGALSTTVLSVGSLGTYTFAGGTVDVSANFANLGTIDFANAPSVINVASGALVDVSAGTFANAANASLHVGANSITTVAPGQDLTAVFASFTTLGLLHTAGTDLVIPAGTSFKLQGALIDHVRVDGTVLASPGAALNLARGLHVAPGGTLDSRDPTFGLGYTCDATIEDDRSGNAGGAAYLGRLFVGPKGSGTFTQSAGTTTVRTDLALGSGPGSSGTLVQTGGTIDSGQIIVGESGTGLVQHSGGTHTTHNLQVGTFGASTGAYELSGTGQLVLARWPNTPQYAVEARIGFSVPGAVRQTGGQFTAQGRVYLGWQTDATGTYTLDGGAFNTEELYVGYSGTGAFNHSAGTAAASTAVYVGYAARNGLLPGRGTYTLTGGSLATKTLYVGYSGTGTFDHRAGAVTVSGDLNLSSKANGFFGGTYLLSGGTLTAFSETVGRPIASPGTLEADFRQSAGANTVDRLTVNLRGRYVYAGGSLTVNKNLQLLGTLDFADAPATLDLAPGASAFFSTGTLLNTAAASLVAGPGSFISFPAGFDPATRFHAFSSQGTIHYAGQPLSVPVGLTVSGSGTVVGNVANAGTVSPGNSPGALRFQGNYAQSPSGRLAIEIAGATAGLYDVLTITGSTSLAGRLDVSLLDGYLPGFNDAFTFLTAPAGVTGKFANAPATFVDTDYGRFDLTYGTTAVALTRFRRLGDLNADGAVDAADRATLLANLNAPGSFTWATGDLTGDGHVDADDFLRFTLGAALYPAPPDPTVPEPATTLLFLAPLLPRRRRPHPTPTQTL
jgi:hypothetical protein